MPFTPDDVERMARAYTTAWSAGDPAAVADYYAEDGKLSINRGDPTRSRQAFQEVVAGFYAEFPGLTIIMDGIRVAGNHAIYLWTLDGTHSETRNHVRISGWEEWDITEDAVGDLKVASSRGWFDAEDYDRQVRGQIAGG